MMDVNCGEQVGRRDRLPLFGYLSYSGDGAASYILTYVSRGRADLGGHAEGMDGV